MSFSTNNQRYTTGEEIANSITHAFGLILAIAGLAVLSTYASRLGNIWHQVSCMIFATTLILQYAFSTLYHSLPQPRAKNIMRVLDHAAIFLLIAGTYTPFTLVTLRGGWDVSDRWTLSAALENLFDAEYRIHGSGLNRPGRNLYFGLTWSF